MLRRIFGLKRDEVIREWRQLHSEELCDLCWSPNIIRVIKPRRMRWTGMWHVCRRGKVHTGFWWGNLKEKDHLEDPGIGGTVILRWIFRKDVGAWTGSIWLRIEM